jgi:hypothetical protein
LIAWGGNCFIYRRVFHFLKGLIDLQISM